MPIVNGAYVAPNWVNDTSPFINAEELNAISNSLALLPVQNGGTGKAAQTANSVMIGNGTSSIKNITAKSGAFYSTGTNIEPQFGVLPVAQGGTGSSGVSTYDYDGTDGYGNPYTLSIKVFGKMVFLYAKLQINTVPSSTDATLLSVSMTDKFVLANVIPSLPIFSCAIRVNANEEPVKTYKCFPAVLKGYGQLYIRDDNIIANQIYAFSACYIKR